MNKNGRYLQNNHIAQWTSESAIEQNELLNWVKCEQIGDLPEARDSHSSCLVNDKIYIYGGQGQGEVFFNDLYCAKVIEKPGNKYVVIWQKISYEAGPYPRTSHTCVSYKNRYLVVIGGETESVNITGKSPNEESN